MANDGIPRCLKCNYELTGLPPQGRCPECGQPYDLKQLAFAGTQQRFERTMARVRTVIFAILTASVILCGGVLQLVGAKQGVATGLFVGLITGMVTYISYLNEKSADKDQPASHFEPPPEKMAGRRRQ